MSDEKVSDNQNKNYPFKVEKRKQTDTLSLFGLSINHPKTENAPKESESPPTAQMSQISVEKPTKTHSGFDNLLNIPEIPKPTIQSPAHSIEISKQGKLEIIKREKTDQLQQTANNLPSRILYSSDEEVSMDDMKFDDSSFFDFSKSSSKNEEKKATYKVVHENGKTIIRFDNMDIHLMSQNDYKAEKTDKKESQENLELNEIPINIMLSSDEEIPMGDIKFDDSSFFNFNKTKPKANEKIDEINHEEKKPIKENEVQIIVKDDELLSDTDDQEQPTQKEEQLTNEIPINAFLSSDEEISMGNIKFDDSLFFNKPKPKVKDEIIEINHEEEEQINENEVQIVIKDKTDEIKHKEKKQINENGVQIIVKSDEILSDSVEQEEPITKVEKSANEILINALLSSDEEISMGNVKFDDSSFFNIPKPKVEDEIIENQNEEEDEIDETHDVIDNQIEENVEKEEAHEDFAIDDFDSLFNLKPEQTNQELSQKEKITQEETHEDFVIDDFDSLYNYLKPEEPEPKEESNNQAEINDQQIEPKIYKSEEDIHMDDFDSLFNIETAEAENKTEEMLNEEKEETIQTQNQENIIEEYEEELPQEVNIEEEEEEDIHIHAHEASKPKEENEEEDIVDDEDIVEDEEGIPEPEEITVESFDGYFVGKEIKLNETLYKKNRKIITKDTSDLLLILSDGCLIVNKMYECNNSISLEYIWDFDEEFVVNAFIIHGKDCDQVVIVTENTIYVYDEEYEQKKLIYRKDNGFGEEIIRVDNTKETDGFFVLCGSKLIHVNDIGFLIIAESVELFQPWYKYVYLIDNSSLYYYSTVQMKRSDVIITIEEDILEMECKDGYITIYMDTDNAPETQTVEIEETLKIRFVSIDYLESMACSSVVSVTPMMCEALYIYSPAENILFRTGIQHLITRAIALETKLRLCKVDDKFVLLLINDGSPKIVPYFIQQELLTSYHTDFYPIFELIHDPELNRFIE